MASDSDHVRRRTTRDPLRRVFRALSPNCRYASRLQSEGLDQPPGFLQRLGLVMPLAICKWCRRYGKHLRLLRHAARERPEQWKEASRHRLSDEARQRMKNTLRSGGK